MTEPRYRVSRAGMGGRKPKSERTTVVRLPVEIAELARRMAARGASSSGIGAFLTMDGTSTAAMPFVTASVACGFPSPADDYMENPLDFNELVGARLPSVFAVRVQGESMRDAGIHAGDIAVIDRARKVVSGCIVVACLNGEFTLKRYLVRKGRVILRPENPAFSEIAVSEEADFEVWGVLRNVVKSY